MSKLKLIVVAIVVVTIGVATPLVCWEPQAIPWKLPLLVVVGITLCFVFEGILLTLDALIRNPRRPVKPEAGDERPGQVYRDPRWLDVFKCICALICFEAARSLSFGVWLVVNADADPFRQWAVCLAYGTINSAIMFTACHQCQMIREEKSTTVGPYLLELRLSRIVVPLIMMTSVIFTCHGIYQVQTLGANGWNSVLTGLGIHVMVPLYQLIGSERD